MRDKKPLKEKTYALCQTRIDILKLLVQHKVLMFDPDDGKFKYLFCACCGFVASSPATARILRAAGWIEKVSEMHKANGKILWEKWGISNKGRMAIGQLRRKA